jgi:hypothetical protein
MTHCAKTGGIAVPSSYTHIIICVYKFVLSKNVNEFIVSCQFIYIELLMAAYRKHDFTNAIKVKKVEEKTSLLEQDSTKSEAREGYHNHEFDDDEFIWYESIFFFGAVALFISLSIGVTFYSYYNDWPWTTALLAASSALLGPIFDLPQQPHPDHGYAFTLMYFIYGQSLFVWTISEVVARLIKRAPQIEARERQKLFEMCELEDLDQDGYIGWTDYFKYQQKKISFHIGWEYQKHKIFVFVSLFCWVWLGIWFCMVYLDKSLPSALYFVLSTLSQMGLATPPCSGEDEDKTMCVYDSVTGVFLSVYIIIGVPLFAYAVGQVAGIMIERSVRADEKKILLTPLSKEEYDFACKLYGDDEDLSLAEFTILELLRLQRVNMEDLEDIRELFGAIDEETTGNVTKPMLAQRNLLRRYGSLDDLLLQQHKRKDASSPTRSIMSDIIPSSIHAGDEEFFPAPPTPYQNFPHTPYLPHNHSEPAILPSRQSYHKLPNSGSHTNLTRFGDDTSETDSAEFPGMIKRISFAEYNEIVLPLAVDLALPGHADEILETVPEVDEDSSSRLYFGS